MIANVWLSLNITTLNAMLQFLVIHKYRFLNLGKLFLNCRTNSRKKKKKSNDMAADVAQPEHSNI